jgi:hypothetical protein
MAQVDPNIALSIRPVQMPLEESPLNRMQRYAEYENALLKSQEYQRDIQDKNELAKLLSGPNVDLGSPDFMRQVLTRAPRQAKTVLELAGAQEAIAKRKFEEQKLAAETAQKNRDQIKASAQELASYTSFDDALRAIDRNVGSGLLTEVQGAALKAELPSDPAAFPAWQKQKLTSYLTIEQQLSRAEPKPERVDIGGAIKNIDTNVNSSTYGQEVGFKSITKTAAPVAPSKVVQLQGELDTAIKTFGVDSTQAKQIRNEIEQETGGLERQRIGQDAKRLQLEARRVDIDQKRQALAEQNAKRDADPAFQQRMAAARATGEATAKDEVKARQTLPGVILRGEEGVRLIDSLVGKAPVKDKNGKVVEKGTAPHPGFETAVGATWLPGSRFVPGTDAADFQARFEQLKGASFLEAFETLKGGGAITEKEGEKGTAAINRMALAQSEREFVEAARDVQRIMNDGIKRARTRASMPQSGTSTAPPTGYVLDK